MSVSIYFTGSLEAMMVKDFCKSKGILHITKIMQWDDPDNVCGSIMKTSRDKRYDILSHTCTHHQAR
jgi:hypothetical protein